MPAPERRARRHGAGHNERFLAGMCLIAWRDRNAGKARRRRVPGFEDSLTKLEEIVAQLERGDLSLEDSVRLFEEGTRLSAECRKQLEEAEGKVEMLAKQRDGSMKRVPFGE